jgi:phenylacetate-coenzyme A ligase PaaK-like adenylate-forming protein
MTPVHTLKRLADIGPALVRHHKLERHETWSREQIEVLQRRRLDRLLRHAVAASSFYRDLYGGTRPPERARFDDLPVVTKTMLMENFDRVVTDPRLRLPHLRHHVASLTTDTLYLGRYRVFTTSGTTGTPGIFVFDRREWRTALAWRFNATEQARTLARTEEFDRIWRPLVVALDRIGDTYVELHGTEVARFIEASLALDR